MKEKEYMELALKEAKKAFKAEEIPVGAVIVKDNIIISKAYNKKNKSNIVHDHAEMIAITRACKKIKNWRLEGCDIYITLEPCPMCASAIEQARIRKIYTGAINNNNEISKITKQILKNRMWKKELELEKCTRLINEFFKNKR